MKKIMVLVCLLIMVSGCVKDNKYPIPPKLGVCNNIYTYTIKHPNGTVSSVDRFEVFDYYGENVEWINKPEWIETEEDLERCIKLAKRGIREIYYER